MEKRILNLLKRELVLVEKMHMMSDYQDFDDWSSVGANLQRVQSTLLQYPQKQVDKIRKRFGFS